MFVQYVSAKIKTQAETYVYRNYVADALKLLTSNTAKVVGGMEFISSYRDELTNLRDYNKQQDKQELSGDEIIRKMKQRISKLGG